MDAKKLEESLQLEAHPEGGKFRQTVRAAMDVEIVNDPRYDGHRKSCTCIYYLLQENGRISWHKHKAQIIFFWHNGATAKFHYINPEGEYSTTLLGDHLREPQASYQVAVTPGDWYAIESTDKNRHVLWSATVAPGFEYKDWEPAVLENLLAEFPQHSELIKKFAENSH